MIRRTLRLGVTAGLLAGAAYAAVRALRGAPVPAFDDDEGFRYPPPVGRASEPAPDPTSQLTAEPSPLPEQDPTPQPSPSPSPLPSPEPLPTPEPSPLPGPGPSPLPGPEPSPLPGPEPSSPGEPMPAPQAERPRPVRRRARPIVVRRTSQPADATAETAAPAPWMEPIDGACPPSHLVKAKLRSGIYHVPGMLNYARTVPDRCYLDVPAAEADGLRPAKR